MLGRLDVHGSGNASSTLRLFSAKKAHDEEDEPGDKATSSSSARAHPTPAVSGDEAGRTWMRLHTLKNWAIPAVAMAGVAYVSWNYASWVLQFDARYWFGFGWTSGLVVGSLSLIAGSYTWRNITIMPENVYNHALRLLKRNRYVRDTLGRVSPSQLRAYRLEHGYFGITREKGFQWYYPNVQMMFVINQARAEGEEPVVAYVDAERTLGGLRLRNVSLLSPDPDPDVGFREPHVIQVAGTDGEIEATAHLRDGLLQSKAAYLNDIPLWKKKP